MIIKSNENDNFFLFRLSILFFLLSMKLVFFIYFHFQSFYFFVFLRQFNILVAHFSSKPVLPRFHSSNNIFIVLRFWPYSMFYLWMTFLVTIHASQKLGSNIRNCFTSKCEETLVTQLCNAYRNSLPLIFAKCMNNFLLFLCIHFHLNSVKWILKFSFEGQRDGKLRNCTKCTHLIYTYTPAITADIPLSQEA